MKCAMYSLYLGRHLKEGLEEDGEDSQPCRASVTTHIGRSRVLCCSP